MKIITPIQLVLVVAFVLFVCACSEFKDQSDQQFSEPDKSPVGSWTIVNATLNGDDITDQMDFSEFRLIMNADGTYQLSNYLPFLVKKDGKWWLNDRLHPFRIFFQEQTSDHVFETNFSYVIVNGKRSLGLTFNASNGCFRNVYTYNLQRDE